MTHAATLTDLAERMFGPDWASPLARLTGIHERTLRRIRQAARDGNEYPAARGVLAAFDEALEPIQRALRPYRR